DVVDATAEPDRREFVLARVERERLQHLGTGAEELAVQLDERLRVGEAHLGRERAAAHVPALLQLEQVAPVPEYDAVAQPIEQPTCHAGVNPSAQIIQLVGGSSCCRIGRSMRNGERSRSVVPSVARSASALPITAANLNACAAPSATRTSGCPGTA